MVENRGLPVQIQHDTALARPLPTPPHAHSGGFLVVLWRRRWIILGFLLLSLAGAFVYISRTTPIYRSSAQVYVQQKMPRIISSEGLMGGGNTATYLFTQCDVIQSTAILLAALESPEVRNCKTLAGFDSPVGYLKSAITVGLGKNSDLITVSIECPYAEDAALLVNAVVNAYITYQNKEHQSTAAEVLKILEKSKLSYEAEFRTLSQAMLEFKRNNGMLSFENDKGNIIVDVLGELSAAMTAAQLELLDAKVVMEAVQAIGEDPVRLQQFVAAEADTQDPLRGDQFGLWSEYQKLQRMAEDYPQNHPRRQDVDKQLRRIKDDLNELDRRRIANYRAVVTQRFAKAQQKEKELRSALGEQRAEALNLNSKSAEYNQLETDARRAEKMLDILDNRIKEINVTEDAPLSISILEVARPPSSPIKPNKPQIIQVALLLGLLGGAGAAFLRDWLDQRLRSSDEISALLQLPVLGVIPHMNGKRLPAERGQQVQLQPHSDTAEAYRTVRTSIYFGVPDDAGKVLLVTSPAPGDGKTTVASNLAIAMAQAGRRVLLLDADCRRPMQHHIFGLDTEQGLTTVLLQRSTLNTAVQKTDIENLFVLPCGPMPTNPSEMLNGQTFIDLLEELNQQYDQVIIDSPPVMPVTDARILAASCDMTVMVLRAERSTRKLSLGALEALAAVGARILGVVVNDVSRGRNRYSYANGYGGYYQYYGHSNGDENNGSRKTPVKAIAAGSQA